MLCWGFGSHYWLSPTSVGVKIRVSACPTLTGDRLSASRTTPLLHWKVLIDYWSIPSYPFVRYDISNSIVSPFQLSLITACIHSITKIIPVSDHLSCSVVSLFEKFYFLFQNVPMLEHWQSSTLGFQNSLIMPTRSFPAILPTLSKPRHTNWMDLYCHKRLRSLFLLLKWLYCIFTSKDVPSNTRFSNVH